MLFVHSHVDPSTYIKEWIALEKNWNEAGGERMLNGAIECTICNKHLKSDSSLAVHSVRFHYDDIEVLLEVLRNLQNPADPDRNTKKRKLDPSQLALPMPPTQLTPPTPTQPTPTPVTPPQLASGDIVAESLSKVFAEVHSLRTELANKDRRIKKLERLAIGLRAELREKDKVVSYTSFSMQLQQAKQLQ